jgi:mRNA interferase RelE/StbE
VPYTVTILPSAARALRKLPASERTNLAARINALGTDPRPPASKALKGAHEGYHRIRAGDYRAIYRIDDALAAVVIVDVGHRSWIY